MFHRVLAAIAAAAVMLTTFAVPPADARTKKEKQYRVDNPYQQYRVEKPNRGGTISLDGRNTGRARTCGFNTFIYDELGVPTGPYCH